MNLVLGDANAHSRPHGATLLSLGYVLLASGHIEDGIALHDEAVATATSVVP